MSGCCGRQRRCRQPPRCLQSALASVDENRPTTAIHQTIREASVGETELFTALEEASQHGGGSSVFANSSQHSDLAILLRARERLEIFRTYIADENREFVSCGYAGKIPLSFLPKWQDIPLAARGEIFVDSITDLGFVADCLSDRQRRHEWDVDLVSIYTIREIPVQLSSPDFIQESLHQVYNSFKGRFGAPGRDFVWNSYMARSDSELFQLTYSQPETECPPGYEPNSKFIRGETFLGGYWVKRLNGGCQIHFVNQTDIKGSLPDWIIDSVIKKSPAKLEQLRVFLLKRAGELRVIN